MTMYYEVSVWDTFNGNIHEKLWKATEEELSVLEAEFNDDPIFSVEIDDSWEEEDDEDHN